MPKTLDIHVRYTVQETDTRFGTANDLAEALKQYLTGSDSPLMADYGPDAWGGYDGAFIIDAAVVKAEVS